MVLVHHHSHEDSMVELDLFMTPMTQLLVEEKKYTEVLSQLPITDGGPI